MPMMLFNKETADNVISELISATMHKDILGNKKIINEGAAFDTEVSSFIDEYDGLPSALVYVWMFGIGDVVVYGRELDDFVDMMKLLNFYLMREEMQLVVYIHNMKYDFQFIKKFFEWDKIFTKSKRDVLFANLGGVEFRDSLVLSGGRSLAFIGDELRKSGYKKAVGELDYNKVRHPQTPLTDEELHYCEMDIRVLVEYIREKIEDDGGIHKIPYTNTGYVRRFVRNACFEHREKYLELMDGLTMTPGCYQQSERAFMGGAVGPNLKYIGKTVTQVTSYDIKSSYPYVMVTGYYPMSYGVPVSNKEAPKFLTSKNHCCQFTLEVWGLQPKPGNDYCFPLSESKCIDTAGVRCSYGTGELEDMFSVYRVGSGRVITALYVKTVCTELDFATYKKFYDLDNCEWRVSEMRVFKRGWLPAPIIKSIVKFFRDKTTLDGVEGREAEYMISKNMLNAIYGMMVEKPVRPDFGYKDGIIFKNDIQYVKKITEYNEKYNRFLFYPWGVWVTAQARWRLYDAIAEVGPDFIYCDTDSVKFINPEKHQAYFDNRNREARRNITAMASRLNIPLEDALPKSPKGSEKCLGVWENEGTYAKFKTLGAKRYLIEHQNGEMSLTVAGTNKMQSLYYLINEQFFHGKDMFENFNSSLVIPADYSKRLVATFIEEERSGWVTDYLGNRYYYQVPSAIHMAPSAYSFSIAERTREAVEWLLSEEEMGTYET